MKSRETILAQYWSPTLEVPRGRGSDRHGVAASRQCAAAVIVHLAVAAGCASPGPPAMDGREQAAVRERNLAYAAAWLAGDAQAVLDCFTDDAVLLPALGTLPAEGIDAIRAFYWPPGSPPFTVTEFRVQPERVSVWGDAASVHGRFALSFAMDAAADEVFSTEGNYLMEMRRDERRGWLISRYIWNHPPWR